VFAVSNNASVSAATVRLTVYDLKRISSTSLQSAIHLTRDILQNNKSASFDVTNTITRGVALPRQYQQGGRIYIEIDLDPTVRLPGTATGGIIRQSIEVTNWHIPPPSSTNEAGILAGIILAIIIGLLAVGGLYWWWRRRQERLYSPVSLAAQLRADDERAATLASPSSSRSSSGTGAVPLLAAEHSIN
jgi:hypothetical protein